MRTKQLRLSDAAQLKSKLSELVGKHVTLILKDNTTQTGIVKSISDSSIVFQDMRLKKTVYTIDQLAELYFDTIV